MLKRIFALFLSLALLVSAVPVQVFAESEDGGDIILGENELPPIPIDPTDPEETEPSEPELGSAENPIMLDMVDINPSTTVVIEMAPVDIPAGKTLYFSAYRVAGMGVEAFVSAGPNFLDAGLSIDGVAVEPATTGIFSTAIPAGSPMYPTTFAVTNNSETNGRVQFNIFHLYGSMENPAALAMGANTANVAEGSQGCFYKWTAAEEGTLTVTMPKGGWMYTINNLTGGVYGDTQWSDSDPVVNPGTVAVAAGDEIQIIVNTYDPASPWTSPAGSLEFTASFEPKSDEPGDDSIASGILDDLTWKVTKEGTLVLGGEAMYIGAFWEGNEAPWTAYADQITAVSIGANVKGIFHNTFNGLKITEITIPEGVENLSFSAFYNCDKLEDVYLPSTLNLWDDPFIDCDSLKNIYVAEGNPNLYDTNGVAFWNHDGVVALFQYPVGRPDAAYKVADGVNRIGGWSFRNAKDLTEVILPETLTEIGEHGFEGSGLESVTIPASVTYISYYAFGDCTDLETIYFQGDLMPIVEDAFSNVEADAYYPAGNETWSEELRQNYGGNLTWVPYGEEPEVPGSTPENAIMVEFAFDENYNIGTASVTLEPGTWYFNAYGIGGMDLTANGQPLEFTAGAGPMMPSTFILTNEGSKAVTYELAVTYPVGSMSNPAALVMGENLAQIEAGNNQGWFFNWTAGAKGKLIITMPQGHWTYVINNMGNPDDWSDDVYGDTQWSDSDPVVNPAVVEVSAGDQIQIMVNTYDPANQWNNPAGTISLQASFEAEHIVPLTLVPMIGEPAQVLEQEDGSYIVYLDMEDVAEEGIPFSVMAYAVNENGEPLELGVKDLKWSTSDSRVATVKSDKYMAIGNVTVKAETDGACVITAVNTKTKDEAAVTIHVRDYAPRLGATSLTMNSYLVDGIETPMVESYGNAIDVESLRLYRYNSATKTYDQLSDDFWAEYVDGQLLINHGEVKNGTHKLLLKVPCANGKTYEYKISVKVSNKLPSVTVKQLDKFNTFYADSTTRFQITAKDAAVVNAFFENDSFQSEFDPETGILTVYYSEAYLEEGGKPVTKGDVLVGCDGYWIAVEKAITVKTEKKAPKVYLEPESSTINTALAGEPSTYFGAYILVDNIPLFASAEDITDVDAGTFAEAEVDEWGQVKLTLTGKKGGTAKVSVQMEGWMEPVVLKHKVTATNKKPSMKLSATKLTLNSVFYEQTGYQFFELDQGNLEYGSFEVIPTAKEGSAARIEADKIGVFVDFDGNYAYSYLGLNPENLPKKGTYEFKCIAALADGTELSSKTFKVVVEDKVPTVKLKSSTVKLNKNLNQVDYNAYAETEVSISKNTIAGYTMDGEAVYQYWLVDMQAEPHPDVDVTYDPETGMLRATLMNSQAKNGSYKIKVYPCVASIFHSEIVRLEKSVTLTVQVYEGKPSISVKSSGKLDTIAPDSAITYTISKLTNIAGVPEDAWLEGEGAELFDVELTEDGSAAVVKLREDVTYEKGKSYKLQLVFDIFGQEVSAKVTVKVNQSSLKFASMKALNLYQSNTRLGCVLTVTAPEGARIQDITLGSKTAKQFLNALGEDALTFVELDDGTVVVSFQIQNPGYLTYGKSYSVYLDITPEGNASNVKPTQLKLTVKTFK